MRTVVVIALAFAIVLTYPIAETGMNDDWSFIRTASDFASSGHLRYNGWAAPLVGFQAVWAALFIRLFGFSFTIARVSIELLTLAAVPMLLRLFRAAGLAANTCLFATLALLLSPLLLPALTSFMTDVPAFLLFAGSLMAALEAWNTPDDKHARHWMQLSALFGCLSGSVRQIYWAAAVWFLLLLAIRRFRQGAGKVPAWICLAAVLAFAAALSQWQSIQFYVSSASTAAAIAELPWRETVDTGVNYLLRFFVLCCILLMPVAAAFLPLWRTIRRPLLIVPLAISAAIIAFTLAHPLPWVGNTLSENGVLPSHLDVAGEKPLVLSPLLTWLIATTGLITLGITALRLILERITLPPETLRFAALTLPFLCLYVAAISIRGPVFGIYDRYSIPIVAVMATLLLAAYQQLSNSAIPAYAWSVLGVFALYGIATTHDSFSGARARLAAVTDLMKTGVKRTEILAGFEFDCWTQVDQTGYINNNQISLPSNAYRNAEDCNGSDNLQFWWRSLTPAIHASYLVTLSPLPDLEPALLEQVPYRTWLPYGTNYAYIQRTKTPLTCVAE